MKKTALIWITALLFQTGMALAHDEGLNRDGGGDRGGGNGGYSGGNGGDRGGGDHGDNGGNAVNTHDNTVTTHTHSTGGNRVQGGTYQRNGGQRVGHYHQGNGGYNNGYRNGQGRNFNHQGSHYNGYNSGAPHHFNHQGGQNSFDHRNNSVPSSHSFNNNQGNHSSFNKSHLAPMPKTGPGGKAFSANLIGRGQMNSSLVRDHMASITGSASFGAKVGFFNKNETIANHYYWHSYGGYNYCHYYYGGCHWYGWNWGGSFLWTQYYGNNWWWYDPYSSYWCWWEGGHWCWQNPYNQTVYIYENGDYAPADGYDSSSAPQAPANGNVETPSNSQANGNTDNFDYNSPTTSDIQTVNPSEKAPNSFSDDVKTAEKPSSVVTFRSPDKNHTVKLVGDTRDAFLYDTTGDSTHPVFLDTQVKKVDFKGSGDNLKVQLTLQDGTVETFNGDGTPATVEKSDTGGNSFNAEDDQPSKQALGKGNSN